MSGDSVVDKLRDEINGHHAAQGELLKWKFIIVGTVAAMGLGLLEKSTGSRLAIFLLPFIALYADLLIRDYDLRIAVISHYMTLRHADASHYEQFVHSTDDGVLKWSRMPLWLGLRRVEEGETAAIADVNPFVFRFIAEAGSSVAIGTFVLFMAIRRDECDQWLLAGGTFGVLSAVWVHWGFYNKFGSVRSVTRKADEQK